MKILLCVMVQIPVNAKDEDDYENKRDKIVTKLEKKFPTGVSIESEEEI